MSGKPAARQGDMTQYGGSIVQGSAGVRIGAPTGVACSRPAAVHPLPHLQQLPDKNARAGGEPRPRLENACGYPLTAAR